jgi:hypothetical protein
MQFPFVLDANLSLFIIQLVRAGTTIGFQSALASSRNKKEPTVYPVGSLMQVSLFALNRILPTARHTKPLQAVTHGVTTQRTTDGAEGWLAQGHGLNFSIPDQRPRM